MATMKVRSEVLAFGSGKTMNLKVSRKYMACISDGAMALFGAGYEA